jgi:hypothetical protein
MLIIPTQRTSNCNYYYSSIGSLACIVLLLSGFIQYYFYMTGLSFANKAYGQEQNIQVEDGRVNLAYGQEQNIQVGRSEDSSNGEKTFTPTVPIEDAKNKENPPPPQQAQPNNPPPQQAQPESTTASAVPTENARSSDNTSDQSAGPVKFTFVDSFWTDYTSLGGVIASTSSESITAQPLPPAIKQEVEPGQGEAVLAVVLRNRGFADATSISGSLDLPSGFRALVTPEDVDSDTALASYNGIVKAGQTFTLYFRVQITGDAHVDREYSGELRIRYFKVSEQQNEDTRSTTLDIPFKLSGKVILSAGAVMTPSSTSTQGAESTLSHMVSVTPGVVNPLKIEISNNGSAIATGVIVNVLTSSTVSSSTAQSGGEGSSSSSINNNNNSAESTTSTLAQQSSSSTPTTMVIVGSPTFNIGLIGANETKEIVPAIFPADAAAGTLTTLNIQISYNDAYGNERTANQVLGIQISPESPQSGLNVLPSSSSSLHRVPESSLAPLTRTSLGASINNNTASESDIRGTSTDSSSTQPRSIQIVAGSVQDLSFAITNNNDAAVSIADVKVSLTSESSAVRIVGDSRWNLQSIAAGSQQELSTRVYASTSLIGNPVFFTVTMQYIRNGNELSTESFQLGAIVVGNIRISVNDIGVSYRGDTPNLVGNLLNEGNTPALFTKIELLKPGTQEKPQMLIPTVSSQFLGDLAVNSPLPFNIPLQVAQQNIPQQVTGNGYPISLRITYSDELRNSHELVVNETISPEVIQPMTGQQIQQQQQPSSQQNAILNNGFVDAYWADSVSTSSSSFTTTSNVSNVARSSIASTLPSEREVGPGEGPSFLAVVLSNTAFSDITGIVGYLELPKGFAATTTPTASASYDTSANTTSNQTAIASLSNVVGEGQTYTLYFKVNVLETAQKGFHEALLKINYFKVPEPEPGTYRVQTITVPFELPGKVILDASSETDDLVPGEANEVKLKISNRGAADAHSVIININAVGGSIISNDAEAAGSKSPDNASSNESGTGRQANQQQQQQPTTSSSSVVASVGARTFNIGTIPANGSAEIATTVYPSSSAGGTLQNLDTEISYNDANGNRRSIPLSLGFRVLPNPPEGGLSVAPSSAQIPDQARIILASTITGSPTDNTAGDASSNNDSSEVSSEVAIIAGRAQDLNFNITNNNRNPITDVVVTLVPKSQSLEILGDSRWTLQELNAQSKARFSTQVFASESLIGSPISFEVRVQYVSGDQIKSDSFSLGGSVIGEIKISINDLSVRYIGDVPNLTGNLLNQGNTKALFTTIELQSNPAAANQSALVPTTYTPQYLGDLEDNSPLPFSIPLAIGVTDNNGGGGNSSSLAAGNYPVSLKITYSDELRNSHEVMLNRTVSYSPPQQNQQGSNQGFLGFGSSSAESSTFNFVLPLVLIFSAIGAAAAVVIIIVMRRRSRTKKISRLMSGQEEDDDDDFEASSDEYLGSSNEDDSSPKQ